MPVFCMGTQVTGKFVFVKSTDLDQMDLLK